MSCLGPLCRRGEGTPATGQGLKAVPYGIELSEDRATMVRESLPEGQTLAPADFLRCAISYRSFSFICCNPPYDYATGEEGRVESQFLERAVHLLADDGVLRPDLPRGCGQQLPDGRFLPGTVLGDFGDAISTEVSQIQRDRHPGPQAEAADHQR